MLTKSDYEILNRNIDLIKQIAIVNTCLSPEPRVLMELAEVYTRLGYKNPNIRCGRCVLLMCSDLYMHYRHYEEDLKKKELEEEPKVKVEVKRITKCKSKK